MSDHRSARRPTTPVVWKPGEQLYQDMSRYIGEMLSIEPGSHYPLCECEKVTPAGGDMWGESFLGDAMRWTPERYPDSDLLPSWASPTTTAADMERFRVGFAEEAR